MPRPTSMHSPTKPQEGWRSLPERKALGCVVCLLLAGWAWLLFQQPEFVGFATVKEALLSKRSLQVLKPPVRRMLQDAAAVIAAAAETAVVPAYDSNRSQPYNFQATANYQKILKYNDSTFAHDVDAELLARPFCGQLKASGPAQNPLEFTSGRWYKDPQGEFFWEPNGCRLRRLQGDEARQCLANRHVVFVGDSVTRYQYLSLVHFISKKQWMWRYGQGPELSLALEGEWPSWSSFYRDGNARIANATDGVAEEKCDCYRADDGNWAIDNREGKIRENREFVLHHFPLNGMTEHPVKLHISYFQVMDRPTFEQGGLNALVRALKHVGHPRTAPDAIIMNQGLWAMFTDTITETLEDHFRTIILTGSNLAAHQRSTHLFWKTTTATLGSIAPEDKLEQLNQDVLRILGEAPSWSRLDARQITQDALNQRLDLYGPGDWIHPLPLVYEQINDLFLNFACSPNDNLWGLEHRADSTPAISAQ